MKLQRWHRIGLLIGIMLTQFFVLFRPAHAASYDLTFTDDLLRDSWVGGSYLDCNAVWNVNAWESNAPDCLGSSGEQIRIRYTFPYFLQHVHLTFVSAFCESYGAVIVDGVRYPSSGWLPDWPTLDINSPTYVEIECYTDADYARIRSAHLVYDADVLPPGANIPPAGVDGTCKLCSYAPTGDWVRDAPSLIDYLACQIGNIFYCSVIPILLGIWRQIVEFMTLIQSVIYYGIQSANQAGAWVNSNTLVVVRYANGTFDNGVTRIENAIYTSAGGGTVIVSGGNTTIFDVLIEFVRQLGTVLNSFVNVIPSIVTAFRDVLIAVIGGIVQIAFLLVQLVITLINVVIMVMGVALRVLSIIPLLFGAFGDGFTGSIASPLAPAVGDGYINSPNTPLAYATILGQPCTDDPYFQMCLGVYVMDNTILLDDSAEGFSLPGIIAFVKALAGLVVLVIIARKVRWAFAKA